MKLFRGYNKDYPNWGVRPEQNHIWATDDLDFAIEYANMFENGGIVEFELNDDNIKLASASDYEELISDEFGGDMLDTDNVVCNILKQNGFNLLYFDDYGYGVYLILDTNLIIDSNELNLDKQINEVLKLAGIQN